MKILPFGVFWGALLLLKVTSCNAIEKFNFNIGGGCSGVLVMNDAIPAANHHYFQHYAFADTDLTLFGGMLMRLRGAHFPLPAILFWFQTLKNEPDADREIRVMRWSTESGHIHYRLLGPVHLQSQLGEAETAPGYLSLPEALLSHQSNPLFTGGCLTFFDPLLYDHVFTLNASGPVVEQGKNEIVTKSWQGDFWWSAVRAVFFTGRPSERVSLDERSDQLTIKVTAHYKKQLLKSYTVLITGVPELAFYRIIPDGDEWERANQKPRTVEQLRYNGCKYTGRVHANTGQLASGYHSYDSSRPLFGTNPMPYATSGSHIRIEQALLRMPGCRIFGGDTQRTGDFIIDDY